MELKLSLRQKIGPPQSNGKPAILLCLKNATHPRVRAHFVVLHDTRINLKPNTVLVLRSPIRPRKSLSNVIQTVRTKLHRSEYSTEALEGSPGEPTQGPVVDAGFEHKPQRSGEPLPALGLLHDFSVEASQQWSSTIQIGLDDAAAAANISRNCSASLSMTEDALCPVVAKLKDNIADQPSKHRGSQRDGAPLSKKQLVMLQPQAKAKVTRQGRRGEADQGTNRVPTPWIEKILETSLAQRNPSEVAQPTNKAQSPTRSWTSEYSSSTQESDPEVKAYYIGKLLEMCLKAGIDPSCLPLDAASHGERYTGNGASATTSARASASVSERRSTSSEASLRCPTEASLPSSVSSFALPPAVLKQAVESNQVLSSLF